MTAACEDALTLLTRLAESEHPCVLLRLRAGTVAASITSPADLLGWRALDDPGKHWPRNPQWTLSVYHVEVYESGDAARQARPDCVDLRTDIP